MKKNKDDFSDCKHIHIGRSAFRLAEIPADAGVLISPEGGVEVDSWKLLVNVLAKHVNVTNGENTIIFDLFKNNI